MYKVLEDQFLLCAEQLSSSCAPSSMQTGLAPRREKYSALHTICASSKICLVHTVIGSVDYYSAVHLEIAKCTLIWANSAASELEHLGAL